MGSNGFCRYIFWTVLLSWDAYVVQLDTCFLRLITLRWGRIIFLDNFGIETVRDSDLVALAYMIVFTVLFGVYVSYGFDFYQLILWKFLCFYFSKYTEMYIYKM